MRNISFRQIGVALTIMLMVAFLVGLGNWQIRRLSWKENLIEAVSERTVQAPKILDSTEIERNPQAWDYSPVMFSGKFVTGKEVYLYTILSEPAGAFGGPGWMVIAPFETDSGATVLVNRGFVPVERMMLKQEWRITAPQQVGLTGLIRLPEPRGLFAAADSPLKGEFFTRDPGAMAHALDVDAPPFIIDLKNGAAQPSADGLPQAGETVLVFSNNHLSYALMWYGLALTLSVFFLLWIRVKVKSGRDKRQ